VVAAVLNASNGFQARNEEEVKSTFFFVRAKNAEYNFSNNPYICHRFKW